MSRTIAKVTMSDMDRDFKKRIVTGMNNLLADEYGLFTKTLNYHWNITGPRFHSLHTFLEGQYRELLEVMDDVAERIRFLGERPLGTVKAIESHMQLPEAKDNGDHLSDIGMLQDLLESNNSIHGRIKELLQTHDLGTYDPGTEDFLVGVLRQHEKMAWMLRSHLL